MAATPLPAPAPILSQPEQAAGEVADEIDRLIAERAGGRPVVLGLATGRTPLPLYRELVRRHRAGELDLSGVVTFNLDEYLGLAPDDPRRFRHGMREVLFDAVGLSPERTHFPTDAGESDPGACAQAYERALREVGGIDLQVLGLGRNGHVAFNEPGSTADSRTRRVELHATTRADAARTFGGLEQVPTAALTMGIATILEAKRLRLFAFGEGKREVVGRLFSEPTGPDLPATLLRGHPDLRIYVDRAAYSE